MSIPILTENTIIQCDNPKCQMTFSVIAYGFADGKCAIINSGKMIPLTGNTDYFCPCCGKNLKDSPDFDPLAMSEATK